MILPSSTESETSCWVGFRNATASPEIAPSNSWANGKRRFSDHILDLSRRPRSAGRLRSVGLTISPNRVVRGSCRSPYFSLQGRWQSPLLRRVRGIPRDGLFGAWNPISERSHGRRRGIARHWLLKSLGDRVSRRATYKLW